uniref:Uncharacterized protein n=1 Tax=Cryptococcus bacillisporus CA1280 TaxID=1296109 RepID=A0A0D0VAX6_CRYGA|nr:hypothetical protein I312_06045 [Cryptococcus bacillisporus CA1280]
MPLFAFLQSLLCRADTAPRIDPLPPGYSSMPVASNILGPTFVPLQLPPDGHMDPGTFKDITEIYNCIRDYSEQILTRWLSTYANHTAALRQLQQAGLYPPLSVVVRDVTPANAIPAPGTSETQPDSAQSNQAIPPPLPEKTKSFPNPPQTSFQVPPKPLPPLKCEDSRPRPASWQAIPETTGAFFKALKRLSESEGLIPQEYAQLLERACRQEVPPVESQSATGDSVLASPIQSYTPEGSVFAIKTKEEHKAIRRIRPPSRDTASRSGPSDGNNADNHLHKISPTTSNTPISDSGKSTLRVTPTVATFSQDKANYQPLERPPTPPLKTDIISLASMSSALEPPGLTPCLQNEPFPIREPHSTPTEPTQGDSENSLTPPSKSAARIAANLAREKSSLSTASEAVSLQPQGNGLFLLYAKSFLTSIFSQKMDPSTFAPFIRHPLRKLSPKFISKYRHLPVLHLV